MSKPNLGFFYTEFVNLRSVGLAHISIIVYLFIVVLSIDAVVNQLSGGLGVPLATGGSIALFIIFAGVTIICQLFVLRFVSEKSSAVRKKVRHIRRMHYAVTICQYFIIALFVYVILAILLTESYSPYSLLLVTLMSYMLSISLMGIFTFIFLSWYGRNRSSVLVLLYGLSFATVVIASVALLFGWMYPFSEKLSNPILPTSDVAFPIAEEGSVWKNLNKVYQYSDMISFFLKWGGTALILHHYSHKIGRAKYWFLLSLPLAYFSLLLIYHFHLYEPHEELETLIFYGMISLNSTFGGILFYIAFKLTSENFKSNNLFRDYLLMAGFGFMLFFSATQASLTSTAYPPYGFATVSTYGLGSYLILIGLYLSALSVSQDERLRSMIKKSTLAESKFLHSIGTSAEQEDVLVKSVLDKARRRQEKVVDDIGVRTSLSEDDIKEYVKEVEKKEEK